MSCIAPYIPASLPSCASSKRVSRHAWKQLSLKCFWIVSIKICPALDTPPPITITSGLVTHAIFERVDPKISPTSSTSPSAISSIHLGFADIPTYSTIFLAGFFIAIVIARKIAGRYRLAKEDVLYGAIYAAIGILIGSKLLYCLTRLPSLIQKWDAVAAGFDKNFMQTLLFLMNYLFGGLVFYGGLIGAFLGIFCYCKQSRHHFQYY